MPEQVSEERPNVLSYVQQRGKIMTHYATWIVLQPAF
jgi:hypothetical protein